ncbi:MAG: FprA family A-type flavoprotein [Candidatus Lokiarchaeia archaeon]|nr:FprA family A-type flavoprotein [Candidatus Lokiarchaeia archaeon]
MIQATKLAENIYWIGANVHTEDLFEGIWPISNGVALNAYLIIGDKIALIELVREWGGAAMTLLENLKSLSLSLKDVDYIVLNHLEPDHTGFTYIIRSLAPKSQIVTTEKGSKLVDAFYGIKDNIKVVKTGDEIDLGQNKKLIFTEIPHVHWPETMVSYEPDSKILFSGDAFGAFGVHQGSIFDDETSDVNKPYWEKEMLRYYANIIAMFSPNVIKAIDSLSSLNIKMIAPSHGLIWRKPKVVLNKYIRYANYNKDYAEPEICVIWGSMYGNTEAMLNAVLKGIASTGVPINIHQVPNEDPSDILADAYKSAGLIIGCPTYEYSMFPPMKYLMELLKKKHIWYKKALYFGSYGWSGGALKDFNNLSEGMHWDILEPLTFNGHPTGDQLDKGEKLGQELAIQVKEIPLKIKDEDY